MTMSEPGTASAEISASGTACHILTDRAPRHRTCLGGKLVYSDGTGKTEGAYTLDCTVRDISEGGAKVTIGYQRALPNQLFLIIVKYCVAHQAELVWLKYPARGLKFSGTYPLDEPLPKELMFLRKLWNDLAERDGSTIE